MELKLESKIIEIKTEKGEVRQEIEERVHPLTGQRCIFNVARSTRPHDVNEGDKKVIEEVVKESEEKCVFCKKGLHHTPLMPDGKRIIKGEFKLFPNLYPFGDMHYVGVLCDKHFLYLNEFKEQHFYDALATLKEFSDKNRLSRRYAYISFNYLPPAGASLIHPHLQILFRKKRTNMHEQLCKKSNAYYRKNKKNFWQDYVEASKKRGLLLEEGKRFYVLASFAPQGDKQIEVIHKSKSSFYSFDDEDIRELSKFIVKVLRFYSSLGVMSLNFTTFSNKLGQAEEFFRFSLMFIARPNLKKFASSDKAFMEVLHLHPVILTLPETLKERWNHSKSR